MDGIFEGNVHQRYRKIDNHQIGSHSDFPKLLIFDGNGRSTDRGRRQDFVSLLNIGDASTRGSISPSASCHGICKGNRAKISKWGKTADLHGILDDPLRVLTAKRSIRSQFLRRSLAFGQIIDCSDARIRGGRGDTE